MSIENYDVDDVDGNDDGDNGCVEHEHENKEEISTHSISYA